MKKKKILSMLLAGTALCASMLFGGCGTSGSDSASSGNDGKVVIYSNADDEAVDAMKKALDNNVMVLKINICSRLLVLLNLAVN